MARERMGATRTLAAHVDGDDPGRIHVHHREEPRSPPRQRRASPARGCIGQGAGLRRPKTDRILCRVVERLGSARCGTSFCCGDGSRHLGEIVDGLMRILLRHSGGWRQVDPRAYSNEDELQALLKESPEIIPRNPPDLPRIVYCREFPVGSYAIDLGGVGSDGSLSLVECKLAKSREAKRTVVGQVLEYAAGVWRMGLAEFEQAFASRTGRSPLDDLRDARIDGWGETICREKLGDK